MSDSVATFTTTIEAALSVATIVVLNGYQVDDDMFRSAVEDGIAYVYMDLKDYDQPLYIVAENTPIEVDAQGNAETTSTDNKAMLLTFQVLKPLTQQDLPKSSVPAPQQSNEEHP